MYFNQHNNFYHGIMFHHFHDDGIHKKGQGSIDKDDFYKIINFIGRKNILDAEVGPNKGSAGKKIAELILSTLEYIDLGLFIIPIILLYVVWLFILAKSAQNE